jgi:hypothetical protein
MIPIKTQFDIPSVLDHYNTDENIEIIHGDRNSNKCYIFFSSHGIYYPNTEDEFREKIIIENRYEWKKNIPKNYALLIFVRDIQKQWYIHGINKRIYTIPKLEEYLRTLTEGKQIICVGSSAGGFAAVLMGCLLQASHVLCFSGQFSLSNMLDGPEMQHINQLLYHYVNHPDYNQFYDITTWLRKHSSVPIFYFYPSMSEQDVLQYKIVKNLSNISSIGIISDAHGIPFRLECLDYLINMKREDLFNLFRNFKGNEIDSEYFAFKVLGITNFLRITAKEKYWRFSIKIKSRLKVAMAALG